MDTTEETVEFVRPAAVVKTLDIFKDPWDFSLLVECYFGVRRFDDFQKRLGISRNILSKRLKSLVSEDVLEKRLYQAKPDRFEYRLTEKGRDLFPIFMAIMRWGERWIPDAQPDGWRLEHRLCGHQCRPETVCGSCKEIIHLRDVVVVPTTTSGHAATKDET